MTTDHSATVSDYLRGLADAVYVDAAGTPELSPLHPSGVAGRLSRLAGVQEAAAAHAEHYSKRTELPPSDSGIVTVYFATTAARLGRACAVLGDVLEATAHLHHPAAAGLDQRARSHLAESVGRQLAAARTMLTDLAGDLYRDSDLVSGVSSWPGIGPPAALDTSGPARSPDLPPAAGEHEPRTDAARRRTPNLVVVAPPARRSPAPETSATVLPLHRT